jgi:hypothetical protein
MTKITESALAMGVLISSIQTADGTMSSRSTHTSSPAARNAVTIAATASRSLREYDIKTLDIGSPSDLGLNVCCGQCQHGLALARVAAGSAGSLIIRPSGLEPVGAQRCWENTAVGFRLTPRTARR